MLDLLLTSLTQGLIYAILSLGIYITYKILDFPDLTVDGSFPLGAAVCAALMTRGVNCFLALAASVAVGALAGLITGLIHVRLHVRDLLAGIITMTALYSINLQIAGSYRTLSRSTVTVFTCGAAAAIPGSLLVRKVVVSLVVVLLLKLLLDLYLSTKSGLLLRAAGDNDTLVTTLARDHGSVKILGLVIANALVALCGALVCQEGRAFSATMGTGQMVFGLAAVIIGTTMFKKLSFVRGTTAAIVGSVIYKMCIQAAMKLGLPANLMKLATAVLFLVILVAGQNRRRAARHGVKNGKEGGGHAGA